MKDPADPLTRLQDQLDAPSPGPIDDQIEQNIERLRTKLTGRFKSDDTITTSDGSEIPLSELVSDDSASMYAEDVEILLLLLEKLADGSLKK